jgi:hypothetical protein
VRSRASENKAEWLLSKCEELERNGFLYRVDTSEWALNAMAALKPNGRDFRMVINLIPLNVVTIRQSFPLATVEELKRLVRGAKSGLLLLTWSGLSGKSLLRKKVGHSSHYSKVLASF